MIELNFNDLKDELSKKEWWDRELAECVHCYRIPAFNLPLPIYFKRYPKVCVDIGANVGAFSYYASKFFKTVYAYEAVKKTCVTARDNLKDVNNIILYNLAVSDISGKKMKLNYLHMVVGYLETLRFLIISILQKINYLNCVKQLI